MGVSLEAGRAFRMEPEPQDGLGHPHAQTGQIPQVRRRRSPIDPPDGSWAVIGVGNQRSPILDALASAGIPAVGYEKDPGGTRTSAGTRAPPDRSIRFVDSDEPDPLVRFNHIVISVDEIDDIEGLAVTSWDRLTGEINTDYYAGICVATENTGFIGDLVDSGDELSSQTNRVFTPHHPAVVLVGSNRRGSDVPPAGWTGGDPVKRGGARPKGVAGTGVGVGARPAAPTRGEPAAGRQPGTRSASEDLARSEAEFVAAYAKLLFDSPRKALNFHRHICAEIEPELDVTAGTESPLDATVGPRSPGERGKKAAASASSAQDLTHLLGRLLHEITHTNQMYGSQGPS
jgi:hypothetical protein